MPSDRAQGEASEWTDAVPDDGARLRKVLPFLAASTGFAAMALLYLAAPHALYRWLLKTWGIDPFAFVFLDTDTVLSAVRCLRQGVDVFVSNPCDYLGRVFDYSPLWLVLAKLPVTLNWLVPIGLVVDFGFLAALLLLPAGRTWHESRLIAFGAVSTAVVFALERGNNDLVLFTLGAIAATLACRSPAWRFVGYGAALLAGLLKYYPMTVMALATRERPRRFLFVILGTVCVLALFAAFMGHDLVRALKLIPTGDWYGDMFGSSTLAGGLAERFHWSDALRRSLHVLLIFGALAGGLALAARPDFVEDVSRLTVKEQSFLLVGGLLVLSCFFTAQNIGYRAIHLILVLPAFSALGQAGASHLLFRRGRRVVLLLLWAEGWRHAIQQLGKFGKAHTIRLLSWGLREILWWWAVTLLIACVFVLLSRSEMGRRIWPGWHPRPGRGREDQQA
jgi:hypothetical protein